MTPPPLPTAAGVLRRCRGLLSPVLVAGVMVLGSGSVVMAQAVTPTADELRDPGRLAGVELHDVSAAIVGSYGVTAVWLAVLLGVVTLGLAAVLTRRAWLAWGDHVRAAWVFYGVARDCGLTRGEIWSLWRAGRGRSVEVRLAMLLSCGALRKFGGRDAEGCAGRLFGEVSGREAA